ncbi:MAG: alpha/beta hydrolase [Nonlabens sp.]|uniref:alpha/beta fold hydrolase n=1 Tax=Nonlabens sp. TaxID=1888209 RepID=UPI00321ACF11
MKTTLQFRLFLFLLVQLQVHAQDKSISTSVIGNGDPVLFLPGFASDATVWDSTIEKFSVTNQCHTVDYAGFGKVAPIEFPWLPTILEDLKTYIKNLDNSNLIIVGHSMGGTIATWLAAQPDLKIKQIVAVDALPCTGALMMPNFSPDNLAYESPYNNQLLVMDNAGFEQMAEGMASGMATSPEHQQLIKRAILNSDRKTYVYGYTDYLKMDVRPLLSNIKIPVTIMGAGQPYGKDMATQTYNNQYANLKAYDLIINENSKHFMMMDVSEWFHEQLSLILAK